MSVEAAMGKAGVLHDVGDTGAAVAATPNGAPGGVDDAFVRSIFPAESGSPHAHMMHIIWVKIQAFTTVLSASGPTSGSTDFSGSPSHIRHAWSGSKVTRVGWRIPRF